MGWRVKGISRLGDGFNQFGPWVEGLRQLGFEYLRVVMELGWPEGGIKYKNKR